MFLNTDSLNVKEKESKFNNMIKNNEDNLKLENKYYKSSIININNTINVDNSNSKDKNININILTRNSTKSNTIPSLEHNNENRQNNNNYTELFNKIYENIDVFKYCVDIIKNEGMRELFNGMSSSVFGAIIQNGNYFCAVKIFNHLFKHFNLNISNGILRSMAINLLSAIITAFVTNPISVLNIRMAKKSKEVILFF